MNAQDVVAAASASIDDDDSNSTKDAFLSALRYAMSISDTPITPNTNTGPDIPTCAQHQVDYMLRQHGHTLLLLLSADQQHLLSIINTGLSHLFSLLHSHFSLLFLHPAHPQLPPETILNYLLHTLSTCDWLSILLPKINSMTPFLFKWAALSPYIPTLLQPLYFDSPLSTLLFKLLQITAQVFDAASYGALILPPPTKVQLLNTWLPFIQKIKPLFDSMPEAHQTAMDQDLCQNIQGAIVSMIVTLPSNDQAHFLAAWMESHHLSLGFPDLTEAFEIWCYRTKSTKRRLPQTNASLCSNFSP